jgi:hypothetical protein
MICTRQAPRSFEVHDAFESAVEKRFFHQAGIEGKGHLAFPAYGNARLQRFPGVRTAHETVEALRISAMQGKHDRCRPDFPQFFRCHGKTSGIHPDFGIVADRIAYRLETLITHERVAAFNIEETDPRILQAPHDIDEPRDVCVMFTGVIFLRLLRDISSSLSGYSSCRNDTLSGESENMSRFRPIDRQTEYLLPPSIQEWLPESHLARYVVDVVEGLGLSALERAYAGRGSDASPPGDAAVAVDLRLCHGRALEPQDRACDI